MTNNEKIQKAEQLIAEANKLIAEIKNNNDDKNILADYINAFTIQNRMYYINSDGDIDYEFHMPFVADLNNPYSYYPTKELAEQAKRLKDFNDKLLAFKYCYDLDYKPDWSDDTHKYYVYYDVCDCKYMTDGLSSMHESLVYFSTRKIAQKCANWLNSLSNNV